MRHIEDNGFSDRELIATLLDSKETTLAEVEKEILIRILEYLSPEIDEGDHETKACEYEISFVKQTHDGRSFSECTILAISSEDAREQFALRYPSTMSSKFTILRMHRKGE